MPQGIVYILTNPCLDGWVKIGKTDRDDIEARLRELNGHENIPLCYRCYAVYKVENPRAVEDKIHSIIDRIDGTLRAREMLASGRERIREFFKISPETAYGLFKDIADLRGDAHNLQLYRPTAAQSQEEEIAEARTRRANNTFASLGIAVGEEIRFLYDDGITARVSDRKNKVEFCGGEYSVTGLASKLLTERYGWAESLHVNGWRFFTKDGVALSDVRDRIDAAEVEE